MSQGLCWNSFRLFGDKIFFYIFHQVSGFFLANWTPQIQSLFLFDTNISNAILFSQTLNILHALHGHKAFNPVVTENWRQASLSTTHGILIFCWVPGHMVRPPARPHYSPSMFQHRKLLCKELWLKTQIWAEIFGPIKFAPFTFLTTRIDSHRVPQTVSSEDVCACLTVLLQFLSAGRSLCICHALLTHGHL
jgi:hypothetical protein